MIGKKTTILYLQKDKIKAYQFLLKKGPKNPNIQEYDYRPENIIQVFKQVKNDFKTKNVRILLAVEATNHQLLQNISIASHQSALKIEAIEPLDVKNREHQKVLDLGPFTDSKKGEKAKREKLKKKQAKGKNIKAGKPEVYLKSPVVFKKPPVNKKLIFLFILILLGSILVTAGILNIRSKNANTSKDNNSLTEQKKDEKDKKEIKKEITEEVKEIDKEKRLSFNIQVLNGTGGPGVAKQAKFYLEDLGYSNIEKDNASNFEFTKTEVWLKNKYADYFNIINNDLKDKYPLSEKQTTLDNESEYDVIIVIGKKEE